MRSYVADLAGGTVTTSVQMTEGGTITRALLSFLSTAVGKVEISRSVSPQIGTAQPTKDVLARLNCSATAGNVVFAVPLKVSVKALDYIYIHQTGAGNVGNITLQ